MRLIDADALSEKLCKTTIFVKDGEVFQRMVNDAPTVSAEAVRDWIPCSERLPDKTGWYVVTVAGLETITDMLVFYNEVSAWSDITDKQKVVAWMPLPEPYKGGEDE